ncbi:unnamed protein product [Prorocentrum cordatum]|uniref:Uncharacterized protein n=1 Tax=Prorocentrum cordatum TaxID=2364126 RepID=A0ABN9QQL0_9DINO|nr:unnamed protein product [Polarella glacialis]
MPATSDEALERKRKATLQRKRNAAAKRMLRKPWVAAAFRAAAKAQAAKLHADAAKLKRENSELKRANTELTKDRAHATKKLKRENSELKRANTELTKDLTLQARRHEGALQNLGRDLDATEQAGWRGQDREKNLKAQLRHANSELNQHRLKDKRLKRWGTQRDLSRFAYLTGDPPTKGGKSLRHNCMGSQ